MGTPAASGSVETIVTGDNAATAGIAADDSNAGTGSAGGARVEGGMGTLPITGAKSGGIGLRPAWGRTIAHAGNAAAAIRIGIACSTATGAAETALTLGIMSSAA